MLCFPTNGIEGFWVKAIDRKNSSNFNQSFLLELESRKNIKTRKTFKQEVQKPKLLCHPFKAHPIAMQVKNVKNQLEIE